MNSVEAVKGFKTFMLLVFIFGGLAFVGTRYYPQLMNQGKKGLEVAEISLSEKVDVSDTSATILWTTPDLSTGLVEYGVSSDLCKTSSSNCSVVKSSIAATVHNVTLANLSPETLYYYRIVVDGDSGGESTGSFTTLKTKAYIESNPEEEIPNSGLDFESFYGAVNTYNEKFDLNEDGVINSLDYFLFVQNSKGER